MHIMLGFVLYCILRCLLPLQWRHNWRDGVSNHQPHHCLLNRLFRRRLKNTSKLRVTGLCAGNSPVTGEFSAQMASKAENVSISWRHHVEVFTNSNHMGYFHGIPHGKSHKYICEAISIPNVIFTFTSWCLSSISVCYSKPTFRISLDNEGAIDNKSLLVWITSLRNRLIYLCVTRRKWVLRTKTGTFQTKYSKLATDWYQQFISVHSTQIWVPFTNMF